MGEAKITLAFSITTNKVMHISEVPNGLSCQCRCMNCGEMLEAMQGNIRIHYFRHHVNKICEGSQETALHELGKRIIIENESIKLPLIGSVVYSNPVAEVSFKGRTPDVTADYDKEKLFFEITVKNPLDDARRNFYQDNGLKAIEVKITHLLNEANLDVIKNSIINEINNKRIIFWTKPPPPYNKSTWVWKVVVIFVFWIGISCFWNKIFKRKK